MYRYIQVVPVLESYYFMGVYTDNRAAYESAHRAWMHSSAASERCRSRATVAAWNPVAESRNRVR